MKALVTLTCVAIVAFVTYFFWNEQQQAQARVAAAERAVAIRSAALAPLYAALNVPSGNEALLHEKCRANDATLSKFDLQGETKTFAEQTSRTCRQFGFR